MSRTFMEREAAGGMPQTHSSPAPQSVLTCADTKLNQRQTSRGCSVPLEEEGEREEEEEEKDKKKPGLSVDQNKCV